MLSRKEFVKIINRLKEVYDFVNETNDRARKLQDAIETDFFNAIGLSISHESLVVRLLEEIFDDKDIISWWIYELDYGKEYKDGYLKDDNGIIIDVSTAGKLYDYLTIKKS